MSSPLARTGIAGLDDVLGGGLPCHRIYLVQGDPGAGKTTLGMQFLLEGLAAGEKCMYIALSETSAEIEGVVASHGWSLDGLDVIELSAVDQTAGLETENTLFESSEVELHETTRRVLAEVERVDPDRVVFDSLSELRLLAQSALRYRRQILALKQYFTNKQITVLLLDDRTSEPNDLQLQSLAHGVIALDQLPPIYGADRRRLRVLKMRGKRFRTGYHELAIRTGGLEVFPRLIAAEHTREFPRTQVASGIEGLDRLLGGGLDYGTSTLVIGPAGTGKSSLSVQYAMEAANRGEPVAMFLFDERIATMVERTRAIGRSITPFVESGKLRLQQVDAAEMGPGEFAANVRDVVERDGCRLVVIDSLNGYLHAMSNEKELTAQLHELLSYLGNLGVATVIVMAQHGFLGSMKSPVDVSYLADTVVLLRYFEAHGTIRKAISVLKKRSGAHENTIRELCLDGEGLRVGEPLDEFEGVLTGVPRFLGGKEHPSEP